jgi:hypothetical protein
MKISTTFSVTVTTLLHVAQVVAVVVVVMEVMTEMMMAQTIQVHPPPTPVLPMVIDDDVAAAVDAIDQLPKSSPSFARTPMKSTLSR